MAIYQFAALAGSTLSWTSLDKLNFSRSFTASGLQLLQQGPNLQVSCQGVALTLATTTIQNLVDGAFTFEDGSIFKIGSNSHDNLIGSQLGDFMVGHDGRDTLSGGAGPDQSFGGLGDDLLLGGEGADLLDGGDGDDVIYGSDAADISTANGLILTTRLANGLSHPVYAASRPGDPNRLFVAELKTGNIKILNVATGAIAATPFLEIPGNPDTFYGSGVFSISFSPNYLQDRTLYALLLNEAGYIEIRSYQASASNPDRADQSTMKVIMRIENPGGHYGGWMGFGPDGYLYITSGDGDNGGDPLNNAQNITGLLGKILRIDVRQDGFPADPIRNYTIPADNPFVNAAGADEIWALGLRNPWRASFDRMTGDFYIGDVGQALREEINVQQAGRPGGQNYGWKVKEGTLIYDNTVAGNPPPTTPPLTDPTYEYAHAAAPYGGYSVTGGYVYRGTSPGMQGLYFFADYVTNQLWSFRFVNGKVVDVANRTSQLVVQAGQVDQIVSFAEDGNGNLYVIGFDGEIFKLDPRSAAGDASDTMDGGAGHDLIYGGVGDDVLKGSAGNDSLQGGLGNDTLDGGVGIDKIAYESVRSDYSVLDLEANGLRVFDLRAGAPEGVDLFSNIELLSFADGTFSLPSLLVVQGVTIHGSSGPDLIDASTTVPGQFLPTSRSDIIFGLAGNDQISGLGGDDRLDGGAGNDTMTGGSGNDTYGVESSGDVVDELTGDGIDTVESTLTLSLSSTTQIRGQVEHLTLLGTAALTGTGNSLANAITGNSGNNILQGLAGADTLNGGPGLDTASYAASGAGVRVSLQTGSGSGGDAEGDLLMGIENLTGSSYNDLLAGNAGDNVLDGGLGSDTVSYAEAAAGVRVNLALTTAQNSLGAGTDRLSSLENLIGSSYDDVLTGSNVANQISGGNGDDRIDGAGGNDTMIGGSGNDTYVVGSSGDLVDESSGDGTDTVESSVSFSLSSTTQISGSVEHLQLLGGAAVNGTGNGLANAITGNSGNNILQGLAGADTLSGGLGLDTASYASSTAAVTVSLQTGSGSGGDAEGDVLIGIENLIGSSANDVLAGNAGDNLLDAGLGIDTVTYAAASAGVRVNLGLTTAQNTLGAGTDSLRSLENLVGSNFDDVLIGSIFGNLISSGNGHDRIDGAGGYDTMIGGSGNDTYGVESTQWRAL